MLKYFKKPADKTGFRIEFVKEGLHFTGEDSPMANLLLSVIGAFAEFERANKKPPLPASLALVPYSKFLTIFKKKICYLRDLYCEAMSAARPYTNT